MNHDPRPAIALVTMLALASLSAAAPQKLAEQPAPEPAAAPRPAASKLPPESKPPAPVQPPARPSGATANPIAITVQVVPSAPVAYAFSLGYAQPNPVTWASIIRYSIAKPGNVSIKLYSITGQEAATLVSGYHNPGNYSLWWDGTGNQGRLAPGVYIYRMVSGSFVKARRLVLVR